jgi:hypothetical protein
MRLLVLLAAWLAACGWVWAIVRAGALADQRMPRPPHLKVLK